MLLQNILQNALIKYLTQTSLNKNAANGIGGTLHWIVIGFAP